MDMTGRVPKLLDTDPLAEMVAYTQEMSNALNPAWTNATFLSGWVTYTGGGGYETSNLKYRKAGAHLEVTGMIRNPSAVANGTNSLIATLPTTHRPKKSIITPCWGNAGACAVLFSALTGDLTYYSGTSNPTFISVNIRIPLDN